MFHGSIVALITPFTAEGVDESAFQRFVDWQVGEGTDGLVPCGTTGESPVLSHDEHRRVVELCVEAAGRRVPVIAGTGSNSTDEAIALTRHAAKVGADAVLVVTPYYNKPTQEGLYRHFRAIHDSAEIPIIIYNIPGRCVVDMSVETMARLAKLPNIVGVKDATSDLARPLRTRVEMARLRDALMPLHGALFLETSPAPVKYAASLLGLASPRVRLPLVEPGEATREAVRRAMASLGLVDA